MPTEVTAESGTLASIAEAMVTTKAAMPMTKAFVCQKRRRPCVPLATVARAFEVELYRLQCFTGGQKLPPYEEGVKRAFGQGH